jgi:hypothetical protein
MSDQACSRLPICAGEGSGGPVPEIGFCWPDDRHQTGSVTVLRGGHSLARGGSRIDAITS